VIGDAAQAREIPGSGLEGKDLNHRTVSLPTVEAGITGPRKDHTMLAPLLLATALLAQNPSTCSGADPAIVSVVVQGMTPSGGLNVYHLKGTVTNLGHAKQSSDVLQFVDIFYDRNKVDAHGIPPLAPGQHYTFGYDFKRSSDAPDGSSHIRFQLDMRQPSAPGSQDCNLGNDRFVLNL
jgi:hypothetical protein